MRRRRRSTPSSTPTGTPRPSASISSRTSTDCRGSATPGSSTSRISSGSGRSSPPGSDGGSGRRRERAASSSRERGACHVRARARGRMLRQDLVIPALDGFPLAATLYRPAAPPRRLVVVNSAMGVRRQFYGAFAAFLAGRGYAALCYDYRGIGGSTGRPTGAARLGDWGERDFAGVLAWARQAHPRAAIGCVGHSLGGQLVGLAEEAGRIDAFLAVAAQSGYWRHWRMRHWPKLLLAW